MEFKPNTIYCGDCKEILDCFPPNCVDLIYIDPPFFTSKNYEVVFGDGYELRGFQDAHWYDESGGRRQDIFVYLDWLRERIEPCVRVLKDPGSLYVHCDWHANSYIRVYILDRFSELKFQNEIIWHYRGGGVSKQKFGRRHDTIFFYGKGDKELNVDEVRQPYSPDSTERLRYKARAFRKGKVYESYEPHPLGKHPDDVWAIQPVMPSSKERKGYPTQKPRRLLELLIKASSSSGDLVLDPMCGCGATIEAAQILRRNWIGIDISPTACKLMREQMTKLATEPPHVWNLPVTEEELKKLNWREFQNWACEKLNARIAKKYHKDMGIDGYTFFENNPISVKQSEHIDRTEVDKFETAIRRYFAGSRREKKGIMVAFSFSGGAYNETSRASLENGIAMELKTVKELLM